MTLNKYIVFDIETTGLSPEKDQITEIGALLIEDGNIIDRFNTLISIEGKVPDKIVELTGITDAMLKGQPSIDKALALFLQYIEDLPLVAHNASFDIGFIQTKLVQQGFEKIENDVYDSLILSRLLLNNIKRHKLNIVADYLDIPNPGHHRADNDCEVLQGIFRIFLESLRRQGKSVELCKLT